MLTDPRSFYGYAHVYGSVSCTSTRKLKMTTFKNDRVFASESNVCNEGCNEQSNEMMVTTERNLASYEDFLPLLLSLMVSDRFSEVFSQ